MFFKKLHKIWYENEKSIWSLLLRPLSYLYFLMLKLRKKRCGYRSHLPVVVVGNLTVGGSGKTPAILALIDFLQQRGLKPGVVSRGYPINPKKPILLNKNSSSKEVGDEPLLIFHRTHIPICVCRDRAAAIQLLEQQSVDVILSDDGLQNFTFHHDIEIVLYDANLKFGNRKLLPAGPLRESLSRLSSIDFIVKKVVIDPSLRLRMTSLSYQLELKTSDFVRLQDWKENRPARSKAQSFQDTKNLAITAIAHPKNFFHTLTTLGLSFESHAFQDHYAFSSKDFTNFKDAQIIMTEKDAIKCLSFAEDNFWCLPLEASFSKDFLEDFWKTLAVILAAQENKRVSS